MGKLCIVSNSCGNIDAPKIWEEEGGKKKGKGSQVDTTA